MMNTGEGKPVVSIVTPSFNSAAFIAETIESVKGQTFTNWELIVVDDASTDNSLHIIQQQQLDDDRIKLIELSENQGAAIARNTGIHASRGQYIAFLDSDDLWLEKKLEVQLAFMQKNQVAFCHTAYEWIDTEGQALGRKISVPEQADYKELLKENTVGCLTVMVDVEQTGPISMPNIRARQDYALWLSIAKRGFIAHGMNQVLAHYRERKHSLSSNKIKMAQLNWYVYRQIEKLSLVKSLYYFAHFAFRKTMKYLPRSMSS